MRLATHSITHSVNRSITATAYGGMAVWRALPIGPDLALFVVRPCIRQDVAPYLLLHPHLVEVPCRRQQVNVEPLLVQTLSLGMKCGYISLCCIRDVCWLGPPAPKVLGSDSKNTSRIQGVAPL